MKKVVFIFTIIGLISCKNKVIQYPVEYENDRAKFMEFSQDINKMILNEDNELIEYYIEDSDQQFVKTSFGFWISNQGKPTESMASLGDMIKYEYEVMDFEEKIIYSKEENGIKQTILGKENLPRGLHASLQLIEEGDSATALYPSFLAYGGYGDQNKVGSNMPLIFKIKVLDIQKKEK